MNSNLIIMLTYDDKTVLNAHEVFDSCKDLDVQFWGFKNVGMEYSGMKTLIEKMKEAGKSTFLEVVTYSEQQCMDGARLAVELGFDYLMGTLFYESVWKYLKEQDIKYFPFAGKVHGSPSILEGTINEIISDGKRLQSYGVAGIDILSYRHVSDPERLATDFVKALEIPVVIAGSIDSASRIDFAENTNAWGFTMGTALFNKKFDSVGDFRSNLKWVVSYMKER